MPLILVQYPERQAFFFFLLNLGPRPSHFPPAGAYSFLHFHLFDFTVVPWRGSRSLPGELLIPRCVVTTGLVASGG